MYFCNLTPPSGQLCGSHNITGTTSLKPDSMGREGGGTSQNDLHIFKYIYRNFGAKNVGQMGFIIKKTRGP
jgi:hypothetical protein